jgi:hypothetical protein
MKALGPNFANEVLASPLAGLSFGWLPDGTIDGYNKLTANQKLILDDLIAKHDPNKVPAKVLPPHTPLEFMELWTLEERTAFRTLGKENPIVEDWLDLLKAAMEVRKSDPRTINGIEAMVSFGVISRARADEVKAKLRG